MSQLPDPWEIYSHKISSEYPVAMAKNLDTQYIADWSNYIAKTHPTEIFKYMQRLYQLLDQITHTQQPMATRLAPVPTCSDRVIIALDHVSYGRLVDMRDKQERKRKYDREQRAKSKGISVNQIKQYKPPITWERIS